MRIYETSNYHMFELIESNRPISWTKIDKMREKIKEKNLTSGYNIIVNSKEAGRERYNTDGTNFQLLMVSIDIYHANWKVKSSFIK